MMRNVAVTWHHHRGLMLPSTLIAVLVLWMPTWATAFLGGGEDSVESVNLRPEFERCGLIHRRKVTAARAPYSP